ncbi:hypothetical protein ACQPXM_11880 [Kribbella sp. CA-253562]|uniref:hypothetical protein n=1 Tax=Kribbella sp. CA-253562 TaxID=3239942 RepID=UPI003D93F79B
MAGKTIGWAQGDVLAVPAWSWQQHWAGDAAIFSAFPIDQRWSRPSPRAWSGSFPSGTTLAEDESRRMGTRVPLTRLTTPSPSIPNRIDNMEWRWGGTCSPGWMI